MGRKYTSYCCVATCVNSSLKQDLVFFTLPTDKTRRMEWLQLIWREDLADLKSCHRYHSVCQDHFAEECMIKTSKRVTLKANSLPSMCLPQLYKKNIGNVQLVSSYTQTSPTNPKSKVQINSISTQTISIDRKEEIQTDDTPSTSTYENLKEKIPPETSRKRKLLVDQCFTESKISKITKTVFDTGERDMLKTMCKKISHELLTLMEAEEKLTVHDLERKYHENRKLLFVNLYYASPVIYNLLQSALRLPDIMTMYKEIPINTDKTSPFLNFLKVKVENMSYLEKHSLLVIDTMPLTANYSYDDKEDKIVGFHEINDYQSPFPAVKALVVIIQGMFHNWKQPIAYALLSEGTHDWSMLRINQWIHELVNKLTYIGLNIRILNFASEAEAEFFEKKWVSPSAPYCFINNRKIYHINDPTMLIKLLRNSFLSCNIRIRNRIAKYEDIVNFYNKDLKSKYRLAPKLTKSHIYPTSSEKTVVRYAVELLSHSVASGISAYVDAGEIKEVGNGTVEFITTISQMFERFDSLNGPNENKRISCDDADEAQLKLVFYLKEMLIYFQNMKLYDANGKNVTKASSRKYQRSFQITLRALICLFQELTLEKGNLLTTRTLNQGVTKDFFRQIRKNSNATDPTSQQFVKAFKKILCLNMAEYTKEPNQKRNLTTFLEHTKREILPTVNRHINHHATSTVSNIVPNSEDYAIPSADYNPIDHPTKHTLIYVCGYLLKKCKDYHRNCEILRNYIDGIGINVTASNISRYMKYSQRNKVCLIAIPCNHFVQLVEKMEQKFIRKFKFYITNCRVEQRLFDELLNEVIICKPCPCFPAEYLVKLFIRLRIAYTVQLNTREIHRNQTTSPYVIPLLLSI